MTAHGENASVASEAELALQAAAGRGCHGQRDRGRRRTAGRTRHRQEGVARVANGVGAEGVDDGEDKCRRDEERNPNHRRRREGEFTH
jgi:hypothetical protein